MATHAKVAEPNVVNGVNVDDLFALIDGVKRDATKAKTNWHVTTTWRGQTRSRAQVEGFGIGGEQVPRRFTIDIDEPCGTGWNESVRKSAGTSVGSAQRLHHGGLRGAVRGARNHPRKPED